MGPIERELWERAGDPDGMVFRSSPAAFRCYFDAWKSLGGELFGHPQGNSEFPDIMSEAIEAAEALGL